MELIYFQIKSPKKQGALHNASGFKDTAEQNDCVYYLDGWMDSQLGSFEPQTGSRPLGVYNVICYDRNAGEVAIWNDALGQRPLYLNTSVDGVIASNDFWAVWEKLPKKSIDYRTVEQFYHFRRVLPPWRTFDKQVFKVPPGSFVTWKIGQRKPQFDLQDLLVQRADENISTTIAAEELDSSLLLSMVKLKELFPDKKFWFGNSGGLDSRVIPHYAHRAGLTIHGFSVTEKRPYLLLNQSIRSGRRVQRKSDISNDEFDYSYGNGWVRLMRDLRVNPHGPGNFHKNAGFWHFFGDVVVNAGNSFTISNDNDFWKQAIASGEPVASFVRKYLSRPEITSANKADEQAQLIADILRSTIATIDDFSLMRCMHQLFLNSASPAGAFESMNFAGDFHYIYHPYATDVALKWPTRLFYGRQVQIELLKRFTPEVFRIRDQYGRLPAKNPISGGLPTKIRNRVGRATSGLQYRRWMKSKWFAGLLREAESQLHASGSEQARTIFRKSCETLQAQDRLDLLKLSIVVTYLEAGIAPARWDEHSNL